ncbi:MAG: hypothetical protein IPJ06_02435 [Saprospiraceae bacterium]|nr:hypothetical protein [Saprospiraceae bacterium]
MRYRFIDRILSVDWNREIILIKSTTASEDVYAEHFDGFPVLPGALQIEAMAQACGALLEICSDYSVFSILLIVEKVKFRRMVHPGDQMRITATLEIDASDSAQFSTRIEVDGHVVASGDLVVGKVYAERQNQEYATTFAGLKRYYQFPLKDAVITGKDRLDD